MSSAVQSGFLSFRHIVGRGFCAATTFGLLIFLFAHTGIAQAFEELTAAQKLIYDKAHMFNTSAGQKINYRYRNQVMEGTPITDRVSLSIEKVREHNKRDMVVDFLSAERRMPFPDFTDFRGNPVIIAMLEHIAQSFGRDTGGGVLYFRNRIRDGLAKENVLIEQLAAKYGDKPINATRMLFSPFKDDSYLAEKPEYTSAEFSIILSDDVPGGVFSVSVKSSPGSANGFQREIVIE